MPESLADLFVRLSAETGDFKKSMAEAAETIQGLGEKAEQFASFGETLAFTEGLRELGVEALTAYGNVQKAQIALTALTGSAEGAAKTIEGLKEVALSDALSFPALVQAQQRMIAFGFSAQQIPGALQAIADAAGATNKDFDSVAASVERMGLSGTASGKQLANLGLSVTDLAGVLGVADEEVKSVFKALDQTDRLEAVTLALQKFQGVGAEVAQGLLGQWQNVKTQFDFVLEDIGKGIEPVVSQALAIVNSDILPFIRSLAEGFAELPAPIKDVAVGLALAATAAVGLATAVAGLELVGFGAALESVGAAALAFAPEIAAIAATIGLIHFSGVITEADNFADDLRRNLPGLGDLVQPLIDQLKTALLLFGLLPKGLPSWGKPEDIKPEQIDEAGMVHPKSESGSLLNFLGGTDPAMEQAVESIKTFKSSVVELSDAEEEMAFTSGAMSKKILEQHAAAITSQADFKQMADAARQFNDSVIALYNTFPATYDAYISKLDIGGKSAKSTLDTITAEIGKAQSLTESLSGKPLADVEAWIEALTKMQATAKAWADSDAFSVAAVKIAELVDQFPKQVDEISNADAALGAFFSDMAAATVPDALNKVDITALARQVLESQKGLDASAQTLEKSFTRAWEAYETGARNAAGITSTVKAAAQNLEPDWTKLWAAVDSGTQQAFQDALDLNAAYKTLGISLGDVESKSLKAFETMASGPDASKVSLQSLEAGWARVSGQVAKLATTDLPQALKIENEYIDALRAKGAAIGQIYDAEAKELELEIKLKSQTGADATAEIIQLSEKKAAIQALIEKSQNLGLVYVGVKKDFNAAFDSLTKGIADNIVEWKNWEDVLANIGKTLAKNLLDTFLTGLFAPLKAQLNETGGLFDVLAKGIKGSVGGLIGKGSPADGVPVGPLGGYAPGATNVPLPPDASLAALAANTAAVAADMGAEIANTGAVAANTGGQAALTGALTANWQATNALVAQGFVVQAHMEAVTSALVLDFGAETANTGALIANTAAILPDTAATLSEVVTSTFLTGAEVADTAATAADVGATIADTAATAADTAAEVADTTAEIADTAAEIANTAALAADTAAQGAVAAANAASGLAGSLAGAGAGLIGAGVSAIAGIVQGIQMSRLINLTGEIEISTRQVKEQLVGGIQPTLNTYLPELLHLADIWGAVNAVNDQVRYGLINVNVAEWAGAVAPGTFAGPGDGSSLPPISPLGSPDFSQAVAELKAHNDQLNILNQTYKQGQPIFQDLTTSAAQASIALSSVAASASSLSAGGAGSTGPIVGPDLGISFGGFSRVSGPDTSGPYGSTPAYATLALPDGSALGQVASPPTAYSRGGALNGDTSMSLDPSPGHQSYLTAPGSQTRVYISDYLSNLIANGGGGTYVDQAKKLIEYHDSLLAAQAKSAADWAAQQQKAAQDASVVGSQAWAYALASRTGMGAGGLANSGYAAFSPIDPNAMIRSYYQSAGLNYNSSTAMMGTPGGGPGNASGTGSVAVTVNALDQSARSAAESLVLALTHLNIKVR